MTDGDEKVVTTETQAGNAADGQAHRFVLPTIVGLGLILFVWSLDDGFHFDDELILADSNVTKAERWHHFLNPLRLRQLTFFSFYLNHLVGGDDAVGYHAVNVMLHLGNSFLLYRLLYYLLGLWPAVGAALIFLAHPIQTEAVLYVYQRSTLLATFFSLLGLIVLSRLQTAAGGRGSWAGARGGMLLVLLLFLLAFESKESALAVPLLILLFVGVSGAIGRAIAAIVLVVALAALGLLAVLGEMTVGFGVADEVGPFSYFMTQVRVLYTYLRLLVVPYPQSLEYDFQAIRSVTDPVFLAGFIGLAAMLFGVFKLLKHPRYRWAGVGAAAFFILLAPTSSVIPSRDFAFEHRLYLPMLGISLFAAFWLSRLRYRNVVLGCLIAVFSLLTVQRGHVWASDVRLWEDTTRKAPRKARAWFNLGGAYLDADSGQAREAFSTAIALQPQFPEAFYNLGIIEQREGNHLAALGWYQRALEQQSDYWPAVNNMGNVRFTLGDHRGAIDHFQRTLDLNRDYWPAQYNLAIVYTAMGRPDDAIPKLRIVLDWRPDFREARYLLALSLDTVGLRVEAEEEFARLGEERSSLEAFDQLEPLPAMN